MNPYLSPGDLVIIFRTKNIKKNDVVVFDRSGDYFIKRVTDIKPSFAKASEDVEFFVEGDNKKESVDSRKFGWIEKQQIIGKVIYKI